MNPSPAYLAPTWRYAGDDWAGANALQFFVYSIVPMLNTDGTTSAGTLMNLAGYSVTGTLFNRQEGRMLPAPTGSIVGDPAMGVIALSLTSTVTRTLKRQALADFTDPDHSLLVAQPRLLDAQNNLMTIGLQPVFVL